MPYDKDVLIRLSFPLLEQSVRTSKKTTSNQNCFFARKIFCKMVTHFEVFSGMYEPMISSHNGMTAIVTDKGAVMLVKMKIVFEVLQQVKGRDVLELPVHKTILHHALVKWVILITPFTVLVQSNSQQQQQQDAAVVLKGDVTLYHSWNDVAQPNQAEVAS